MSRCRRGVVAASVAVALLTVAVPVWWFGVRDRPWVPTCTDLSPWLQRGQGGRWTVTDPDEYRDRSGYRSSSICELSFASAGQGYSGTLSLSTATAGDAEAARADVRNFPCTGAARPADIPEEHRVIRMCSLITSTTALVSVWATGNERRVTARSSIDIGDDAAATTAYAQRLSRLVAAEALIAPEPT